MNGVEAFLEKETNQLGSRICHVKLCIPFILNGAFTNVLVTHAMCINAPPPHMLTLSCALNKPANPIISLRIDAPFMGAPGNSLPSFVFRRVPESMSVLLKHNNTSFWSCPLCAVEWINTHLC